MEGYLTGKRSPTTLRDLLMGVNSYDGRSGLSDLFCMAIICQFNITSVQDLKDKMDEIEKYVNTTFYGITLTQQLFDQLKTQSAKVWLNQFDLENRRKSLPEKRRESHSSHAQSIFHSASGRCGARSRASTADYQIIMQRIRAL